MKEHLNQQQAIKQLVEAAKNAKSRLEWLDNVHGFEKPWINELDKALKKIGAFTKLLEREDATFSR